MAAIRPIAVANSASAIPGATTASEVFLEAAIDWKLDMMPQTVPNRPTNGPAEPTGASTRSRRSSRSISRAVEFPDGLPGPERLFEAVHRALGARIEENLVDRDRPDPYRTSQQPQHDHLDDPCGLQK